MYGFVAATEGCAMSDGFELQTALNETMGYAYEANRRARLEGVRAARLRAEYRCELAKEIARLRANGVAASLAEKMAHGAAAVSDAAMQADMADVNYQVDREEVNLRKRDADIIREQIARDYSEAKFNA